MGSYEDTSASAWPDFFIVGAPRAGTTSLWKYIGQHPDVWMSAVKEPHYFASTGRWRITSKRKYLQLFSNGVGFGAVGEASTTYLRDEGAPWRIRQQVPHARIIVSLRDPLERTYSSFLMRVRDGAEQLGYYDALQRSPFSEAYIGASLYSQSIKRYFDAFGRGRVHVLMFEDLIHDPEEEVRKIFAFLGVDTRPAESIEFTTHNPGYIPRGKGASAIIRLRRRLPVRSLRFLPAPVKRVLRYRVLGSLDVPPPDPRAKELLIRIFGPDLAALEALLGRSLPQLRKGW